MSWSTSVLLRWKLRPSMETSTCMHSTREWRHTKRGSVVQRPSWCFRRYETMTSTHTVPRAQAMRFTQVPWLGDYTCVSPIGLQKPRELSSAATRWRLRATRALSRVLRPHSALPLSSCAGQGERRLRRGLLRAAVARDSQVRPHVDLQFGIERGNGMLTLSRSSSAPYA